MVEPRGTSATWPSRLVLTIRWSCSSMPLNSCLMISFSFPGIKVTSACRVNSPPAEAREEDVNSKTLAWDELCLVAFCYSWANASGIQGDSAEHCSCMQAVFAAALTFVYRNLCFTLVFFKFFKPYKNYKTSYWISHYEISSSQRCSHSPMMLKPFLKPGCSRANAHPITPLIDTRGSSEGPTVSGRSLMAT